MTKLEEQLQAAVAAHDLLQHPYYQAWSMGTLTRGDLAAYAGEYLHQVEVLPELIGAALQRAPDAAAREALATNLAEELGYRAPAGGEAVAHRTLWIRFAAALGAVERAPSAATVASAAALHDIAREGGVEALAMLWAYEAQTARVAKTKREGLASRYGMSDAAEVGFFAVHEDLDVHHAADLLAALERACPDEAAAERACQAAARSARAQWAFLDGVEAHRQAAGNA